MIKVGYLLIYFLNIFFDDSGKKIETLKIMKMPQKDYSIGKIVEDGGIKIGDTWYPYHQMYKIVASQIVVSEIGVGEIIK